MKGIRHQYIDRETSRVRTERLYGIRVIAFLYSRVREDAAFVFKAVTSRRMSAFLAFFSYDSLVGSRITGAKAFMKKAGIDFSECLEDPETLDTPRKIFERKIRYWETRPLPEDPRSVVSPADSKVLIGSLSQTSLFFLKDKFFNFDELFGWNKDEWKESFRNGSFAVFRLTPEKYHYNHVPVSGRVVDIYDVPGSYHSCNPGAVIIEATPYSKNRRTVTIIDTDVDGGTEVGLVAMIEIVALLIGDIVQSYSENEYADPVDIQKGMFIRKGQPKSLYRPGSSTDVLMFQKERIVFSGDLASNMDQLGVSSLFSEGFGKPLVETDVRVRTQIGRAVKRDPVAKEGLAVAGEGKSPFAKGT